MRLFGTYEVVKELTRRGQISTLKCRDASGATVILKHFESPTPADRARIAARGAALSKLDHPGLADARGVHEDEAAIAIAYDWIPGETVDTLIARGQRFTDAELFECTRQLLEALDHAHCRDPPVMHRDVKPQNVVWTGERFVLIDFGAAREVFADSGTASVVGTTGYAAPEQFVGGAEPRSDQYGVAATVLHMATHKHPTDLPLAGLRIDLTKTMLTLPMRRLLGRMLEPHSERRFPSAAVALGAVETEKGLEPWDVAFAPLRGITTVVKAERRGDELHVDIPTRTHPMKWLLFGMFTLALVPLYFLMSFLPHLDPTASLLILPMQIALFILAPYLGSRAMQEWRSRIPAKVTLTPDRWILEHGKEVHGGDAPIEIRATGESAASSTLGLTPVSMRGGLIAKVDGDEIRFAHGLLPVEAKSLAATLNAFQRSPDEVVFEHFESTEDDDHQDEVAVAEAHAAAEEA